MGLNKDNHDVLKFKTNLRKSIRVQTSVQEKNQISFFKKPSN